LRHHDQRSHCPDIRAGGLIRLLKYGGSSLSVCNRARFGVRQSTHFFAFFTMSQTDTANTSETLGFQAEVKQLLHLMIHSLYSNKEIFLRELVSNASDACDKLRFEAIDNPALLEGDPEMRIRVEFDKDQRTITISDNGIGMSRDEAIANLGTIARSGTKEFFSQLTGDKQKDTQLIGQFGVGFLLLLYRGQ